MASKKEYDNWGKTCIKWDDANSKRKSTKGTVKKTGSKKKGK